MKNYNYNKNKIARFIAFSALSIIFVFMIFIISACSNKPNGETGNNNPAENESRGESAGDTDAPEAVDVADNEIQPDLPDRDFGGYNFRMLVRYYASENHTAYQARDMYSDEENGDPINDAVYKRNRYVEDKYNCVISQILAEDHQSKLQKSVKAGSDDYDLYYTTLNEFSGSVTRGDFMDLNSFPYLNLEAPWWDANAINALSIGRKLYFCPSDLILLHNDSSSAIVFNKKMIKDYQMEDPYALVLSGKWTVDALIGMTKSVYGDINGDGKMDSNDLYGFVCYRDAVLSIMHSAGGRICEKDENDLPYLTLNSETSFRAFDKAFELMYAPSAFNLHKELEGKDTLYYATAERMFMEDRALFYWILLHDIEKFRNMDSDFGILPVPKLTEGNQGYGSTVNQYHGQAIAIPATVADSERNGIILEALTAKSKYTLIPAYYERTLQRKVSRDDESAAMLDIIFESHVYDAGYVYNFGNYAWDIIYMTMTQKTDIASLYEKAENRANKDIDKLIANLQKLEE